MQLGAPAVVVFPGLNGVRPARNGGLDCNCEKIKGSEFYRLFEISCQFQPARHEVC